MAKKIRRAIQEKMKKVEELAEMLKRHKSIVIIDLRKTPDRLLQKIRKAIREEFGGEMKVAKKAVIMRALKKIGVPKELDKEYDFPAAVIAVDVSPYRLALFFEENKIDVAAKPGDVAPYEIVVPAGETDLPPGPTLSELKAAGVNVKIEKGKIVVAKDSVLAKAGERLSEIKVKALQTLGIKPFKAGINYHIGFDGETVFPKEVVSLTPAQLRDELIHANQQAFNLSFNASYPTPANISLLLQKAFVQGRNVAINGNLYSPVFIKELLQKSFLQAKALHAKEGG